MMRRAKLLLAAILLAVCGTDAVRADDALARIKTIVVIYAENRSFDHLYGSVPGANGIADATAEQKTQLDHDGTPLPYLTIFGPPGLFLPTAYTPASNPPVCGGQTGNHVTVRYQINL